MPTRFLTWEMLIMPGSFGADNKVEGICLGFYPVLAVFSLCIYFLIFRGGFICCMQVEHMKAREIKPSEWSNRPRSVCV